MGPIKVMEKTSIDHLQPGLFISLSSIGWLQHPFLTNEFCISSEKQIRAQKEMGLKEILWVRARSTVKPLAASSAVEEEDFGSSALAGMLDEKRSRMGRVRVRRDQFARRERDHSPRKQQRQRYRAGVAFGQCDGAFTIAWQSHVLVRRKNEMPGHGCAAA